MSTICLLFLSKSKIVYGADKWANKIKLEKIELKKATEANMSRKLTNKINQI